MAVEWPLVKLGVLKQPEDKWETIRGPDKLLAVLRGAQCAMTESKQLSAAQEKRLGKRSQQIFKELVAKNLDFDKDKLVFIIDSVLREYVPANTFSYSQPIELRVDELVAGVRADVGISLYGPDLDVLKREGDEIARGVSRVPGATEVRAQQIAGLPNLRIRVNRKAIARYGINAADVLSAVEAIGGHVVGQVLEGQPRFVLQVRFAPACARLGQTARDQDRRSEGTTDSFEPVGRPDARRWAGHDYPRRHPAAAID